MKTLNSALKIMVTTATFAGVVSCTAAEKSGSVAPAPGRGQLLVYESDASGFNTRSFFYDNGEEVVAFDSQFTPEIAQKAIEYVRTKTANPITYLVLTHPNPDKFNAMGLFQKIGAKVVASQATANAIEGVHAYKKYFFVNMAKMFTEANYPQPTRVDLTFIDRYELSLRNGERIELRELSGPGVSSNQTVAWIPHVKSLLVGDLVHYKAHAWLEGGIVGGKPKPTLESWRAGLRELERLFPAGARIYGGRGAETTLMIAVAEQIRYLSKADKIVTAYVRQLKDAEQKLTGSEAAVHHQALQKELEAAFPDYGLGYMIQYGVYGLANSKL